MKTSDINFTIQLDQNNLPESIDWEATDSGVVGKIPSKAVMLAVWDPKENNTLKIDLWTKDMMVDEMKLFFHQTLLSMAGTFERATGEDKMAGDMKDFCQYFAEKMNLLEKKN